MADNYLYSAPINIVRYRNGTLLKLMASTHEFKSYDYDAEKNTGTFSPDFITIVCKVEGDISIGQWSYSTDGSSWSPVIDGRHGMTIYDNRLVLSPESDLYKPSNSNITIMCTADTGGYYDTITIVRTIDPIVTFSKVYTDLKLEEDRIFAIASKTQIERFMKSEEYRRGESYIDVTSAGIELSVSSKYATKAESKEDAKNAVDDLFEPGGDLSDYNTYKQTVSQIQQTSNEIVQRITTDEQTLANYGRRLDGTITGDTLYYLATAQSSNITWDTVGWTDNPQSDSAKMTSVKKYLWMYHEYQYADTTSEKTRPFIAGVYGDTGAKGDRGSPGAKGETGVSVTSVYPIYFATNTSAVPEPPNRTIEDTSVYEQWTKAIPEYEIELESGVNVSYSYLFTCDEIVFSNGNYGHSTVVLDNAISSMQQRITEVERKTGDSYIIDTVTQSDAFGNQVKSEIEQNADSIRLKADAITWESDNSSMSADGTLECRNASIGSNDDEKWVSIVDGQIVGGIDGSDESTGYIDFTGENPFSSGPFVYGEDGITLCCPTLYVGKKKNEPHIGFSGDVEFIASIQDFGGLLSWHGAIATFVNGILVDVVYDN